MDKMSAWLNKIDDIAKEKGKHIETLWQFAKFSFVSFLVTGIQLFLVNALLIWLRDWNEPLPVILNSIFTPSNVGEGNDNWGYVLPFFLSNLVANTVGYFLNKKKTFKSNAPMWHFVVYIIVLFSLILFCTWVQGIITYWLSSFGIKFISALAATIAAMVAGTIQFIIIFPLQKFVLLKEENVKSNVD